MFDTFVYYIIMSAIVVWIHTYLCVLMYVALSSVH